MGQQKINQEQRRGGFKVDVISGSTFGSTGNKSITGVGFKPKLVRFTILPNTSGQMNYASGSMDRLGNQFVTAVSSNSGTTSRSSSTSHCIGYLSTGSTTWTMQAAFVSMDDDGFTLSVSPASSAFAIAYEAYA